MKALVAVILFIILIAGLALLGGWLWMLGLGAFAHIFKEPKASISYWHSVLVAFLVNLLLGGLTRSSK